MKNFTKLIVVATTLLAGSTAFAQAGRKIDLKVTLVSPAENQVIEANGNFALTVTIKNNGPDNLVVGDTVAYESSVAELAMATINTAIPSGQSVTIPMANYTFTGTGTDLPTDFCVAFYDINTSGITANGNPVKVSYNDLDTTNNIDCNKVTFKKAIVSIFEFNDKEKEPLTIFPNPASDQVKFELNLAAAEHIQVSVKDITGREVMHKDFGKIQAGSAAPLSLDISGLRSGMYIVEMNGADRKAVGRFTKQ